MFKHTILNNWLFSLLLIKLISSTPSSVSLLLTMSFRGMMPGSIHRSSQLKQVWAASKIKKPTLIYCLSSADNDLKKLFLQPHPSLTYFCCCVNGITWSIEVQRGKLKVEINSSRESIRISCCSPELKLNTPIFTSTLLSVRRLPSSSSRLPHGRGSLN